jgi:hypothetical protein
MNRPAIGGDTIDNFRRRGKGSCSAEDDGRSRRLNFARYVHYAGLIEAICRVFSVARMATCYNLTWSARLPQTISRRLRPGRPIMTAEHLRLAHIARLPDHPAPGAHARRSGDCDGRRHHRHRRRFPDRRPRVRGDHRPLLRIGCRHRRRLDREQAARRPPGSTGFRVLSRAVSRSSLARTCRCTFAASAAAQNDTLEGCPCAPPGPTIGQGQGDRGGGIVPQGVDAENGGELLTAWFKTKYRDWPITTVTNFVKSIHAE